MPTNLEPGSSRKMKKCLRRKTRKLRKRKMKQQNMEESRKDVIDLEADEDSPRFGKFIQGNNDTFESFPRKE